MSKENIFTEQDVKMVPDCLVAIEKAYQMDQVPMHRHDFIEIAFVASGSALHHHVAFDGKRYTNYLIQGDVFSVQIGERHAYEQCGTMALYNISLKDEFLARFKQLNALPGWNLFFGKRVGEPEPVVHMPVGPRNNAAQILDRAVAEYRMRLPGYETVATALVVDFLVSAMRSDQFVRPKIEESQACILNAISMMEEKPECHFTLEQLARALNISTSSFSKKFRAAIGVSPMDYLLKIRLLQVQHLLIMSSMPISEIAEKCGFCTANYMIKLFRREHGVTPARYRKTSRTQPSK